MVALERGSVSNERGNPVQPAKAGGLDGHDLASEREREIFIDSLLVRVHLIIEMSRPALRHGSLNSLFQVALSLIYLRRHMTTPSQNVNFGL